MQKRSTKGQKQGKPGGKRIIIDTDKKNGQSLDFPQAKEKKQGE